MSNKLTDRQLKALRKANARKDQRLLRKEQRQQHQAELVARRPRPPRRSDWRSDEDSTYVAEKIRRPKPLITSPATTDPPELPSEATGTVIEIRSSDSLVMRDGHTVRAILPPGGRGVDPTTRSPLAVGDRVQLEPISTGQARIVAVAPRRTALSRDVYDRSRSGPHKGQVLAANIDQVVIVCSPAEPPFRPRLIDRYLVAASRDGLTAVVCLNKVDLGVAAEVEAYLIGYASLGIQIARTSAVSGAGIEQVRAKIVGSVSLFTGHSGVGKSSLLNALEPDLSLRVGDVTEATAGQGKGRHTTSSARLVPLSSPDTFVVDTPGIRSFGIRGMAPRELAAHFTDIAALAPGCAYRDCLHRREPDCAVAAQAGNDSFLRHRLDSYRAMLAELR